jgi:hypothetical protein
MRPIVGIAHAAWAEGRADGLMRLLRELEPQGVKPHVQVSTEKEHAQQWAVRLWQWAAKQDAPAILLNDDVSVSPELVDAVDRMTDALPDEIISLHCQLPVAKSLAEAGVPYLRTFWLSGPGYVLPRGVAAQLVDFVPTIPKRLRDQWNEDGYAQMWSWGRRRAIVHSLPALVQHDTEIPSTLGYDNHTLRVATADWRSYPVPKDATPRAPMPFVENQWMSRQNLLTLEAERDYSQNPVPPRRCWWCQANPVKFTSASTGAGICGECVANCATAALKG